MAVQPQSPAEGQVHGLRWLVRPRLTSVLDAANAQAVVLCAPAGYGKTVLARQWLEGRPGTWCTPAGGAEAIAHAAADSAAWLAIEDYHLLAESVDADVERLLSLTPLRLLVTTRRRPGWATARRVLYGNVVELGREELALTPGETSALVGACVPGLRELVSSAEGWPAVVALAARRLELAATLLAAAATELIAAGQLETVERWLVALGDAAEENPGIRLARAEVLLRRGEPFAAAELAEEVAAALPAADPHAAT